MSLRLLYAYDALCGWCFGLIPALRGFAEARPDVAIEVVPGGLFVGADRPYSTMSAYIRRAQVALEERTGCVPSEAFHAMILREPSPKCDSVPPSHALLQMNRLSPERALEFAHEMQVAHFQEGKDLNLPETYAALEERFDFPAIDKEAAAQATADDPAVSEAFSRVRELAVRGYPTLIVLRGNTEVGRIGGVYETDGLVQAFEKFEAAQEAMRKPAGPSEGSPMMAR